MASSQPKQRPNGSPEISPAPIVLYVADDSDLSRFHAASLRAAGYKLQSAFTADEALRRIEASKADVVVVGRGLSFPERLQIEDGVRRLRPKPRVILLYDTSIAQTERADAVLNVNSEPQHLVQTIRYLLTGSD